MKPKLIAAATLLIAIPAALGQAAPGPATSLGPRSALGAPMMHRGGATDLRRGRGPESMGLNARLLPPGTWWRNQEVVSRVGVSAEQQKRMDQIFLDSRVQLVHMHASLEEGQLRLDSALNASPFNQGQALSEIDKIADTRAALEKANAKMLLNIRAVLTADQWTKLQAEQPGEPPMMGRRNMEGRGERRHDFNEGRPGPHQGDNRPNVAPPAPPAE